jgi:hypothetical protein
MYKLFSKLVPIVTSNLNFKFYNFFEIIFANLDP